MGCSSQIIGVLTDDVLSLQRKRTDSGVSAGDKEWRAK